MGLSDAVGIPENRFTDDEGLVKGGWFGPRVDPWDNQLTDDEGVFQEGALSGATGGVIPDTRVSIPGTVERVGDPIQREAGQAAESLSEFAGDLASETASSAAEGAVRGLFGDLKSAAGTIVLGILALIVGSIVLGFSLPFGGDS